MKKSLVSLLLLLSSVHVPAIWVPSLHEEPMPGYQQELYEPPGGTSQSYTWVEVPDVGITILPSMATGASQTAPATSEENSREAGEAAQRSATIPRFNDVSADLEYGFISFDNGFASKFGGFGISAKARYERRPDDYSGFGVRVNNEFTKYTGASGDIPGSDFLLIGPFYRRSLTTNVEVGGQVNTSLLFRRDYLEKFMTDWALNPVLYGVYTLDIGRVTGYAGGFAGYTYSSFSGKPHQFPYAAIVSAGTTFGERVALQGDLAVSHQFLIVGVQAPIYLSRLFSLTPGVKYPLVFEATKLQNVRVTVGVSSRW